MWPPKALGEDWTSTNPATSKLEDVKSVSALLVPLEIPLIYPVMTPEFLTNAIWFHSELWVAVIYSIALSTSWIVVEELNLINQF